MEAHTITKGCLLDDVEILDIHYDHGYVIKTTKGDIRVLYQRLSKSCPCYNGIILVHQTSYPLEHSEFCNFMGDIYINKEQYEVDKDITGSTTLLNDLKGFKVKGFRVEVVYEVQQWQLVLEGDDGDEIMVITLRDGTTNAITIMWPNQDLFIWDGHPNARQIDIFTKTFYDYTEFECKLPRDHWDKCYIEDNE